MPMPINSIFDPYGKYPELADKNTPPPADAPPMPDEPPTKAAAETERDDPELGETTSAPWPTPSR